MTKNEAFQNRYPKGFGDKFDYDTAVPQPILDDIMKETGQYCRHFVYGYGEKDGKRVEGFIPLTDAAAVILEIYAYLKKWEINYITYPL